MAFHLKFFLPEQLPTGTQRRCAPLNGAHLLDKVTILTGTLLMLTMLSGCVHQKFVSEPYLRWGEESLINQSGGDESLIVRALFPPEPAKARACVLLVHGMNEHIGRYGEVARYFAQQFIVAGFDFYAHGLSNPVLQQANLALASGASRQEISDAYLAQALLRDLEPLRRTLHQALRKTIALCDAQDDLERPVFIVSHSLGALVTTSYLMQPRHEDDATRRVQGVILLARLLLSANHPAGAAGWLANPLIKV